MTSPEIREATVVLKEVSADEKLRQAILDRELNRAAYCIEMGAARAEGREAGLAEGEARGLRTAIESIAELLGIAIDGERRRKLESMARGELTELAQYIRRQRAWPR